MPFKVESTGFTIATTYCFVLTVLPLLFHLELLLLCSDLVSFVNNLWCWLFVHVHVDTLPQTVMLTFCPSLVGPDQTGLVQPALLPVIAGENGTCGSPCTPVYSSSGSLETGPDYWQMKFRIYVRISYFCPTVGDMRAHPRSSVTFQCGCLLNCWMSWVQCVHKHKAQILCWTSKLTPSQPVSEI